MIDWSTREKDKPCFLGVEPFDDSLLLNEKQVRELVLLDPAAKDLIKPFLKGEQLYRQYGGTSLWIVDLGENPLETVPRFHRVFQRILPAGTDIREFAAASTVALRGNKSRLDFVRAVRKLRRFIVCQRRTSANLIFAFVESRFLPSESLVSFPYEDDYSFGVLQSSCFDTWIVGLGRWRHGCSPTVMKRFPWPTSPGIGEMREVAEAAVRLRKLQSRLQESARIGLTYLYGTPSGRFRTPEPLLRGHEELNCAVLRAYGLAPEDPILAYLQHLSKENLSGREYRLKGSRLILSNDYFQAPGLPDPIVRSLKT